MAAWERWGRPHPKAMDDRRRAIARSRLQAVALLAAGVVLMASGMAPACEAMERKWGEIHCERLSPTVQSLEALVVSGTRNHRRQDPKRWPDPGKPPGAVLYAVVGGLIVWLARALLNAETVTVNGVYVRLDESLVELAPPPQCLRYWSGL